MALEELKAYRILEKFGPFSWGGVAVFRCPNKGAVAGANSLHGQPFPDYGGGDGPTCQRARIKYHAQPGKAWIIGYYKSGFGPVSRHVGKARLVGYTRTRAIEVDLLKDQDDKIIYGPDPDGIHEWVVVEGTALSTQSLEMCVVETAIMNLDLPSVRSRHRCINANALPQFGNAPAGALLFWDYRYWRTAGAEFFNFDYIFRVSPYRDQSGNVLSWNSGTYSQKGLEAVIRMPAFVIDDPTNKMPINWTQAVAGEDRDKTRFISGYRLGKTATDWVLKAVDKEPRRPYRTAGFSDLDGMLAW